eukprot:gnl/Spiro4/11724_TR6188_c0_g2_i1.p1 gnl/Spiro4/11724_TR6188_c0_g2~~gnl/Spiro4/11724_TR6188_c0_g2_i1.p1  ORF type:complete len:460 (+),score=124.43 gnl/Spiro4/11724_TR6188_c0_g2_i1:30-1382(+)
MIRRIKPLWAFLTILCLCAVLCYAADSDADDFVASGDSSNDIAVTSFKEGWAKSLTQFKNLHKLHVKRGEDLSERAYLDGVRSGRADMTKELDAIERLHAATVAATPLPLSQMPLPLPDAASTVAQHAQLAPPSIKAKMHTARSASHAQLMPPPGMGPGVGMGMAPPSFNPFPMGAPMMGGFSGPAMPVPQQQGLGPAAAAAEERANELETLKEEYDRLRRQVEMRDMHKRLRTALEAERAKMEQIERQKAEEMMKQNLLKELEKEVLALREEKIAREASQVARAKLLKDLEEEKLKEACNSDVAPHADVAAPGASPLPLPATVPASSSSVSASAAQPATLPSAEGGKEAFISGWQEGREEVSKQIDQIHNELIQSMEKQAESLLKNPSALISDDDALATPDFLRGCGGGSGEAGKCAPAKLAHLDKENLEEIAETYEYPEERNLGEAEE